MEIALNANFLEFENNELEMVNGGSKEAAQAVLIIGGAVMLGIGAPLLCAATAGSGVVFATAYLMGISLGGSAFFI